jgi:hypothetical protein
LADDEDPASGYRTDVMTGARDGSDQILVERYYGMSVKVASTRDADAFLAEFPQVAGIIRHLGLPPADALSRAFALSQRHANQVCEALSRQVAEQSKQLVFRSHPPNCTVSIAGGRSQRYSPAVGPNGQAVGAGRLALDTETFDAVFAGRRCFLGNTKEFALLEYLNGRPGKYVTYDSIRLGVWQTIDVEKNNIQRTVSNLERRLHDNGLSAVVIDGKQKGHYRLVLGEESAPVNSA